MSTSFSDINIINIDQDHMLGRIHSMTSGSVVDGPGIRHVIFLQGCQFKCLYCHNRDTWDMQAGKLYSVAELMDEVLSYARFYDSSNGGVTISGGEALLQPEFVNLMFRQLKKMGIHTCLDTNGNVSDQLYSGCLDEILSNTDLVMLDIKHIDKDQHLHLVGTDNQRPLSFAKYLSENHHKTRIRYVVVPGYTDDKKDLQQLAEFISTLNNIERVELLPYHRMGKNKWIELEQNYPLKEVNPPTKEEMNEIRYFLETNYQFKVLL